MDNSKKHEMNAILERCFFQYPSGNGGTVCKTPVPMNDEWKAFCKKWQVPVAGRVKCLPRVSQRWVKSS